MWSVASTYRARTGRAGGSSDTRAVNRCPMQPGARRAAAGVNRRDGKAAGRIMVLLKLVSRTLPSSYSTTVCCPRRRRKRPLRSQCDYKSTASEYYARGSSRHQYSVAGGGGLGRGGPCHTSATATPPRRHKADAGIWDTIHLVETTLPASAAACRCASVTATPHHPHVPRSLFKATTARPRAESCIFPTDEKASAHTGDGDAAAAPSSRVRTTGSRLRSQLRSPPQRRPRFAAARRGGWSGSSTTQLHTCMQ